MLMNSFTPPQRFYQTPEVEILHLTVEQHFAVSGGGSLVDMEKNGVIEDELDD